MKVLIRRDCAASYWINNEFVDNEDDEDEEGEEDEDEEGGGDEKDEMGVRQSE